MNKISSYDEYISLVNSIKKESKNIVTNCYMFPAAIIRYIELGRAFYTKQDGGLLLFFDEEKYYKLYYYLRSDCSLVPIQATKPVVMQEMYAGPRENRKPHSILIAEEFEKIGFKLIDTMQQIRAIPDVVLRHLSPLCKYAKEALKNEGFTFGPVSLDMMPQIFALLEDTPEIPFNQIPYFTDDELLDLINRGIFVGIKSADGEICAVHQSFVEGRTIYGWLAVKEKFKKSYGMAPICTEYLMEYAKANGLSISGWIADKNSVSIKYHKRIGFEFMDRYMDEWVLE